MGNGLTSLANVVDTDIVVVGSGAAGSYSAIKASTSGLRVLLVSKSLLTRGGCSRMSGQHWGPAKFTSPQEIEEDVDRNYNQLGEQLWLVDRKILTAAVAYSEKAIRELEEMGVYWRRTGDGTLENTGPPKPPLYPVASAQGESGSHIMDILGGQLLKMHIPCIEEAVVTSLLTNNGSCVGVTALNYREGEFFIVRSKATILASGHAGGYLWKYCTATRDCTGDGVAMAYRAGARLTNIEFQSWHFSDQAYPESARRLVHLMADLYGKKEAARMVTKAGRSPRQEIEKSVKTNDLGHNPDVHRILAESYGKRGGLYATYTHWKPDELLDAYPSHDVIVKLGFKPSELIPLGTSAHTNMGGLHINEQCETSLAGLYAAGGVANGSPTVLHCLWSGETSARSAAERARQATTPDLDWSQVREEETRVSSFLKLKPKDGFTPAQVKQKIREVMWGKMWFLKNEMDMTAGKEEIQRVRKELLPKMGLVSVSGKFNFGWVESLDVDCMLDVCEIMILASMMRKESRGTFKRTDFPQTDENWFKRIIVTRSDGTPNLSVESASSSSGKE